MPDRQIPRVPFGDVRTGKPPLRILVVEDSPTSREFLVHLLSSDPELQVVGAARDGAEALAAVERLRPDLVTMDLHMPNLNGFDATRKIMETYPVPIVVVTGSCDPREVATSFQAMEAGALAVMARPFGLGHPEHERSAHELMSAIKALAEVKVIRRWPRERWSSPRAGASRAGVGPTSLPVGEVELVAVGASTGGPLVLQTLLTGLAHGFPAPVVVVQHIAAGFTEGLLEWLSQSSALPLKIAQHGERLEPGQVYFAPEGAQMAVSSRKQVVLTGAPPEHGLRPSVSHLFRSVATAFGPRAVGVLLTGMGHDGAAELKLMRDAGATTIAQDEASSVVFGMPGAAVQLEAATCVLPAAELATTLNNLVIKEGTRGNR